jgi:hypothetical protein
MATSTYNVQIKLALADLNQQEKPNYTGTAKKYDFVESTLPYARKANHYQNKNRLRHLHIDNVLPFSRKRLLFSKSIG